MKLYLVAGEASGDLHGANFVAAFNQIQPGAEWRGMGGDRIAAQGVVLSQHISETNFMGFVEVAKNLPKILRLFRKIENDILQFRPNAVVLIDYPGFNLRLAKFLHKHNIPVYYYIAPQVWAWKKGRVKQLKAYTRKLLTILPFEPDFFAREGMRVDFVGHPLLDAIQQFQSQENVVSRADSRPILALLPGSRRQEIRQMLPDMVEAAAQFSENRIVLAGAPGQPLSFYQSILGQTPIEIWQNQTYTLLLQAKAALVTSGTATLETALFGVPQAVCYRGGWLSYQIARRLVQVKYISLVNLILDKPAVKELIQNDFTVNNLSRELNLLLNDEDYRTQIQTDYHALRQLLGNEGASERAARLVAEDLWSQV